MAIDSTLVTPEVRLTPFTGLSETIRERSGIARAEEVHTSFGIWPATAAGDNRSISFTWDLNPDYGYVLMDCSCIFLGAGVKLKMNAVGFMEIGTDTGPGSTQKERQYYQLLSYPARTAESATTAIGSLQADHYNSQYPVVTDTGGMTFNIIQKPTGLLYPFPGISKIEIATVFSEEAKNQIAYSYRFFARFLQYDITQGYHYAVQSAALTR